MLSDSFQHCSTETMLTLLTENRSQHGESMIAKGAARWLAADPKRISLAGEVCTSLNIQMSSLHLLLQTEGENNNNNGNGNGNNGGDGGGSGGGGNRPGGGGGSGNLAAFGRALSEAGGPLSTNNNANLASMLMSANQNLQGMNGSGGAQLNGGLNGLPQNLLNAFPAGMSIQSMLAGGNGGGQGGDLVAQLAQMTGGGGLGDNNGLLSLLSPRGMADNPQLWNGGGGNGMRRSSLGTAPLQQQLQQQLLQQQLQQQMGGGNGNSGGKPPRRASAAKSNYGDDDSEWETSQGSPVRESQPRGGRGGRGSRGGGGGGKRGWDNDQGDGFGGRGMRNNNNNGNNRGGMKDDGSGDGMLDDSGRQVSRLISVLFWGGCTVYELHAAN